MTWAEAMDRLKAHEMRLVDAKIAADRWSRSNRRWIDFLCSLTMEQHLAASRAHPKHPMLYELETRQDRLIELVEQLGPVSS